MTDRELYLKAKEISKNAYAPFSKFHVGTALLTKKGNVYLGVNVENSTYGATICAERNAVLAAITAGEREFDTIAIVANDSKVYPCGICRQFLFEFGEEIRVVLGENEDKIEVYKISELLPNGFRLEER